MSWPVTLPWSSSPKPFPCILISPSLFQSKPYSSSPSSYSPRAGLASQPKPLPGGRQKGRSAVFGRSQGFSKELSPQSSLSLWLWKHGWLTITYNMTFENQGFLFFLFCSEVSLWADLSTIKKNLVLLRELVSSCGMREWVTGELFSNEFLPFLASNLGSPKKSPGPWILSEGVTANTASWQIAGPNCPQSLAWTSQEHLCPSPCKVTSRWE